MKRTVLFALLAAAGITAVQAQPLSSSAGMVAAPAPAGAPAPMPIPVGQGPAFVDRARVLTADPQYESVQVPRQECRTEWVTDTRTTAAAPSSGSNIGGAVVGGVVGAIVGNQIGKGHGREAATGAGAIAGALIGNSIANQGPQAVAAPQPVYEQRQVQNCRTVNETQSRINGYRVTYEYHGRQYSTVMRDQPGTSLPVRVTVTPEPEYRR